eukprot:Sspe_Gene.18738::Locus_6771_Transcript_1_1_Confidence_1.000_Length_463::g.18738::m.18738
MMPLTLSLLLPYCFYPTPLPPPKKKIEISPHLQSLVRLFVLKIVVLLLHDPPPHSHPPPPPLLPPHLPSQYSVNQKKKESLQIYSPAPFPTVKLRYILGSCPPPPPPP